MRDEKPGEIGSDSGFYRVMLSAVLFIRDQGCKQIDHLGGSCQSLVIIWTRLRGGDGRLDPKVDKMHRKLQVGVSGEEEDTESCISAYEKPIYPIIFLNFFFLLFSSSYT